MFIDNLHLAQSSLNLENNRSELNFSPISCKSSAVMMFRNPMSIVELSHKNKERPQKPLVDSFPIDERRYRWLNKERFDNSSSNTMASFKTAATTNKTPMTCKPGRRKQD